MGLAGSVATLLGVMVFADAEAAVRNTSGVAVIIGNQDYGAGLPKVDYAANDAKSFRSYVVDVLGYDPANIIYLENATKAQLEAVFGNATDFHGKLWRLLDPGRSDVTVYYSGHGVPGSGQAFLLPVDADPNTPQINGYAVGQLYENLSKLDAKQVTVFLDACFSGQSVNGSLTRTSAIGITPKFAQAAPSLSILTAAAADQVAVWDEETQHGMFTRYLLDALYGAADTDEFGKADGRVTLAEAKSYLDRNMTRAARRIGYEQSPTSQGGDAAIIGTLPPGGAPPMPVLARTQVGPATKSTVQPVDMVVFTTVSANVRAEPATAAALVATLNKGVPVSVNGKMPGWYRIVLTDGRIGYLVDTQVQLDAPPEFMPPPAINPPPRQAAPPPVVNDQRGAQKPDDQVPAMFLNLLQGILQNAR